MIKCSKCNGIPSENDVMGWKCNSCGKTFKTSKTQLHNVLMKKKENSEQTFLKCPVCKNGLDDGNETIVWKCSCGSLNRGKLKDFEEEVENAPKVNLIKCPECGKEISDEASSCPNCGCLTEVVKDTGNLGNKKKLTESNKVIKKILPIGIGLAAIIIMLFVIKDCAKCEHEYDTGIITKEPTCTEEGEKTFTCSLCEETKIESVTKKPHTYAEEVTKEPTFDEEGEKTFTCGICDDSYTEAILVLDKESFNQNIYDQMIKFYHEGDYISALIVGRDAKDTRDPQTKIYAMFGVHSENTVNSTDDAKSKIDKLTKEILDAHDEFIQEQIQSAIENGDYEILDTLHYYKGLNYQFDSHIEFSGEQEWAYIFVNELQGEYRYYESEDSNIQLKINKFNLQIGDKEYSLHFKFIPEWDAAYKEPRLFFENGSIEEIRTGLIAVTYEDGTCVKYQSDVGKEREEKQKQREENRKKQKEKAEQEYLANEPKIGMTADEVKASNWGSPQKINKTTYEWGTTEQWCYPNNEYIYFEDGVVTAIQESN